MDLADPSWLGPSQAARLLNVSRDRVAQLARAGTLKTVSTPLGRLIDAVSLEEYRAAREQRRGAVDAVAEALRAARAALDAAGEQGQ